MPGFEVYLQFDSLSETPLMELRGADLRDVRAARAGAAERLGISTTLVVTLKKGLNDDEIGSIIDFALQQPCVRGVTFQPMQAAGRLETASIPRRDRLTLTEVRRSILEQTHVFRARRRHSGALPSRLPGDGVCAEDRRHASCR